MLESIQAMSLLAIMEILGPVLLGAGLIYAMVQWSRRRRGATEAVREQATRQLYREGAREESIEGELRPADTSAAHSPPARANCRVTRQY
jgi:hypothetical protein